MKLTVQNAEIKTATVEVKTLTISGKQVTLAVFRQLREAELIVPDGTFRGTPWGTVNYHVGKRCDLYRNDEHLHVVWQMGSDLHRAFVTPASFSDHVKPPSGPAWMDAALAGGWLPKEESSTGYLMLRLAQVGLVGIEVDAVARAAIWPGHWRNGTFTYDDEAKEANRQDALGQIRQRLAGSWAELAERLKLEVFEELARRQRHRDRWLELNDLPQLFIAV